MKDGVRAEATGKLRMRLRRLERRLSGIGPVMRGSVVRIGKGMKGPYLSVSVKGRTRLVYLGEARAKEAARMTRRYRALERIVLEMTEIRMELLRRDGPRAGRAVGRKPRASSA